MGGLPDWSPRHFGPWGAAERPGPRIPQQRLPSDPAADPVSAALALGLVPTDRLLGAAELVVLLGCVVEQAGLWQALADVERTGSDGLLLLRGAHLEVRVIRWSGTERASGWHDHDRSAAAVRVLLGALLEQSLGEAGVATDVRIASGTAYPYEPEHVHRLDPVVAGTLSLHAWSPPQSSAGFYDVDAAGRVRRTVVDL